MDLTSNESLEFTLQSDGSLEFNLSEGENVSFELSTPTGVNVEAYNGSYEVNASSEAQTLSTRNKLLTADMIINPIPSNYGLITWNGSTLTVS